MAGMDRDSVSNDAQCHVEKIDSSAKVTAR
jgi:hypothetical protein